MTRTILRAAGCLVGVCVLAWFGCSTPQPTGIVVGVTSQIPLPRDLRAIHVLVEADGAAPSCTTYARLPITVDTRSSGGRSVTVTVAGFAQEPAGDCANLDGALLVRKARTTFVDGQLLYLPMALRHACALVACSATESCSAGECTPIDVDSSGLIHYSDALAYGDTSFCFPVSKCADNRAPVVPLGREDPCTFVLPVKDPANDAGPIMLDAGVNVQLVHDDLTTEMLDLDPKEGFSVDPAKQDRFTVSPGLCRTRFANGKVNAVLVDVGCPEKPPLSPICTEDAKMANDKEPQNLCVSGELTPTRSALYVLLDHSASMKEFFGATKLQEALNLALQAPTLRTSLVGITLLPANASDCGAATNRFATPDVPFGVASTVAKAAGDLLGDSSKIDPSDPMLFLDAALAAEGGYRALENLASDGKGPFNNREVLIVGNRDLWAHCSPGVGDPVQHAFIASSEKNIHTAVIALKAPPEAGQFMRDPVVDALSIARAGGGPWFDASVDSAKAGPALTSIVANLGSCLYDVPPGLDLTKDPASAKVSYLDLVVLTRTNIDYNPACVPDAPGVIPGDGWNLDSGHVRLCGSACNNLHFVLDTSAQAALVRHYVPPAVPIEVAQPCK